MGQAQWRGINEWNRGIAEANRVKKSLLNTRLTPVSKLPPPATPVLWSYIYQKLKILYDVFHEIVVSLLFFCRMKAAMRIFCRIETNIFTKTSNLFINLHGMFSGPNRHSAGQKSD